MVKTLTAIIAIVLIPIICIAWEYANCARAGQRILVPLNEAAVEVNIISIENNSFAVAISKYGVGICQIK